MNINVLTLEDNKKYYEIAKIELNSQVYIILSPEDESNLLVRKLVKSNQSDKMLLEKLDTVEEFNQVIDEFMKKFQR